MSRRYLTFAMTRKELEARLPAFVASHGPCKIVQRESDFAIVRDEDADAEFEALNSKKPVKKLPERRIKSVSLADRLAHRSQTRWLIRDHIERGVIALMAGPRGAYKSFLALDWSMRVAMRGEPVYVLSAEGGDYDRRAQAWLKEFGDGKPLDRIPLRLVERRADLNSAEAIEDIRLDCKACGVKPALFVLDTFSKLSGGLEENDNSEVKQFIGLLDNGLKRADTAFDATVLVIAHTGHGDKTRARGASALGSDTDAEYIVSKKGDIVTLTRQRFKSSPELPPLHFAPEIIELDYADDDDVPVTSVVMRPSESPKAASSSSKQPQFLGVNQKAIRSAIDELAPSGGTVSVTDVRATALKFTPHDPDDGPAVIRKRQNLSHALDDLVAKGSVFLHGPDRVSLTRVVQTDSELPMEPELVTDIGAEAAIHTAIHSTEDYLQ